MFKRIFAIIINFFKLIKKLSYIIIIVILISFNVLTLASATIYSALHGLISTLPIYSLLDNSILNKNKSLNKKYDKLKKENANLKKNAKKMRERIGKLKNKSVNLSKKISSITRKMKLRMAKVATANVVAMPLEAVPLVGIGVIVASTVYEIHESCETMKDLHKINIATDPDNATDDSDKVCGLKMPSVDDLKDKLIGF